MILFFAYRNIRRAAYVPALMDVPLTASYQSLPFPEQLASGVLRVCNLGRVDKEPFRTAPTHRLNGLLQTLASDVVVLRRPPADRESLVPQWLYCPADRSNPLPEKVFHRLLEAWAYDLRPEAEFGGDVRELVAELRELPPIWPDVDVPLLRTHQSDGGTAQPNELQYLLATDYFARRIQELEPYDTGTDLLRFRAVARGPRQQGAELMSQPLPYESGGNTWWFSVIINLTLHTVPFDSVPTLHLHLGLRRWATIPDVDSGKLRLGFGCDTSVYLRPTAPWLPDAPISDRYGIARLTWDRDAGEHRWRHGDPAGLLSRLALNRPFPLVSDLLSRPDRWIRRKSGIDALVVHNNRMRTKHGVAVGVMSHQRSRIVEWAEQALFPELVRVPDLLRSRSGPDAPANKRKDSSGEARARAEERNARARRISVGRTCAKWTESGIPVFEPRLLWQSEKTKTLAINGLIAALGLTGDGGAAGSDVHADLDQPLQLTWDTEELAVRLRCVRLVHGLGDGLGVDQKSKTRRDDHVAAFTRCRQRMAKFLTEDGASIAAPDLAVVELAPRKVFRNRENDPKFPLRLGSADVGVYTQFIADRVSAKFHSAKKDERRAIAVWMDGLRQRGASVVPIPQVSQGLPAETQYLAIWMASLRRDGPGRPARRFPIAVLVRPDSVGADAVLGWDLAAFQGVGAWTSYPRFLTRLPELANVRPEDVVNAEDEEWVSWSAHRKKMELRRRETERFVKKVLLSPEVKSRPTVLLAHSQNARQLWTWMQDGVVVKDMIRTGHTPEMELRPWLRLVRVRTGDQRETAQWWGIDNPSEVNGLAAGFWERTDDSADARVFYSTSAKPATFKDSAVEADKLTLRTIRRGERKGELTIDTAVPGWNPNLLEIAVVGCHPGDVPESIAMAVHQLRQAPDHLDALRLPLPLHLAALAQEYVLPLGTSEDDLEEDEEAAEDPSHEDEATTEEEADD